MTESSTRDDSSDELNLEKIRKLLRAKDDTQKFVGLALLKTILDNSSEVRDDGPTIRSLWASIPPRFLDRLLRTGSSSKGSREMLELAISILHTFSILLPEDAKGTDIMIGRIPGLVNAILLRYFDIHATSVAPTNRFALAQQKQHSFCYSCCTL